MVRILLFILTLLLPGSLLAQNAEILIQQSAVAYGGDALDKINFIQMHHIGHKHWIEQSENPHGPFVTSYEEVDEIRGVKDARLYQKIETKMFQSKTPFTSVNSINDGFGQLKFGERSMAIPLNYLQEGNNWLSYGPEYLLNAAQKSKPKFENRLKLEGVDHDVISFSYNQTGYKLFINSSTHLISEAHIETYLPNEFFFSLWGKFTTRIQYSIYALHKNNIVYPLQWDVYRNEELWKKITINDIAFLETTDENVFVVPDEIKAKPVSGQNVNDTKLAVDKTIEVAKGIFVIPGNWFTGWAEQEDGILVIESPISSGYSVQLINEIKKRYPSKKIKGAVISSDAWPHLAGVREYFANKIPVYTHTLNKEILDKISLVDHSPLPDHQQLNKLKPEYKFIDKAISISDSNVPVQIIPVNGEGGERMVVVYFPNQKVLYASDLVQQSQDKSFFFIEYLAEVHAVIKRNKLDVETVYAMHTRPLAWREIETVLEKNK